MVPHHSPVLGLLLFMLTLCQPGSTRADEPVTTNKWAGEIAAFARQDRLSPAPPKPILFTGSSSVRLWTNLSRIFPGRPILNRGFGGSHFSDLLEHFNTLVAPYDPSVILVYEGDNDIASGKSPERVLADFNELRRRIHERFPHARCAYLDTFTVLLDPAGQPDPRYFIQDRLHLNADGYRQWEKVVAPWLALAAGPVNPSDAAPRP
jgi:lysophospholipase L1-like esterase